MQNILRILYRIFRSDIFFYTILGFLILETLWFVFSAAYPMAFDEDFHLGVIRIYAGQWSPFLNEHPAGADQFGAIMRDPSYLYHYLMSFPYRLITYFVQDQIFQVVLLRLINVALFAWGVVLFRKVMVRAGMSRALTNVSLALFVLIPIVPQLAAQINYDNLIMVLLPLMCLCVLSLVEGFRQQRINAQSLLAFLAVSLGMSIVKYAALPFIIAAVGYLTVAAASNFRGVWHVAPASIRSEFARMSYIAKISLIGVCAIGGILFAQRYVVNVLQYGAPVPDCGKVLSVEQCSQYGPWGRDYWFQQTKPLDFDANKAEYMVHWVRGMWLRSFFAVNGPASDYTNYQPLWIPSRTAIIVLIVGIIVVGAYARKIFSKHTPLIFFGVLIVTYVSILWIDEFNMYAQTAQPVAINGRYLLPVLPLFAAIMGRGFSLALQRFDKTSIKTVCAAIVLLLFLHGGGVFTFILRSDASWYWPSYDIQKLNDNTRSLLAPVTIEGNR